MHFLQQRYEGQADLRTAVFIYLFPERLLSQRLFLPTILSGLLSPLSLLSCEKVGIKPICEGRSRLVLMKEEAWMSYCTFIECRIEALVECRIEACYNRI